MQVYATTSQFFIADRDGTRNFVIQDNGNVGIGTTNPTYKLDIDGTFRKVYRTDAASRNYIIGSGYELDGTPHASYGYRLYHRWGDGGWGGGGWAMVFGTAANPVLSMVSGNVGIGTLSPTYQLELSTDSAAKPSTTTWTTTSDRRVKKDIRPYTNGLSIIKGIKPVWFKYNGKGGFPDDNQDHIGVIAQEVIKVAPYTINTYKAKLNPQDKKETELLNFNPHALIFDLINSVKELDAGIVKLTQENQELKRANKELKSEFEDMKTHLNRLEARVK